MLWKLAAIVAIVWLLIRIHKAKGCVLCGLQLSGGENPATESGLSDTPLQIGDGSSGTGCHSQVNIESTGSGSAYSDPSGVPVPIASSSHPFNHYGSVPRTNYRLGGVMEL